MEIDLFLKISIGTVTSPVDENRRASQRRKNKTQFLDTKTKCQTVVYKRENAGFTKAKENLYYTLAIVSKLCRFIALFHVPT